MDVQTAFLNGLRRRHFYGTTREEYCRIGFYLVCKLNRTDLFLNSSRHQSLGKIVFIFLLQVKDLNAVNMIIACMYIKEDKSNVVFLISYVDDILIICKYCRGEGAIKKII